MLNYIIKIVPLLYDTTLFIFIVFHNTKKVKKVISHVDHYAIMNVVKFGKLLYICNPDHYLIMAGLAV